MIEKCLAYPDSPITIVDGEESRPWALAGREKFAPVSKRNRLIGPPQLLIPRVCQVQLRQELVWGPLGTFSPDCLQSLIPGAYTTEDSLFSIWSFADQTWSKGWLRCLRAILLEIPVLSTVIPSPSLFTWVTLGIFLRLFQSRSDSHCWGFSLSTGSFFFFFGLFSSSYSLL